MLTISCRIFFFVFAHKFFNSSSRVNKLLFSGKKWMTICTNVNFNIADCRTSFKSIPTCACDSRFFIFWVNALLQQSSPLNYYITYNQTDIKNKAKMKKLQVIFYQIIVFFISIFTCSLNQGILCWFWFFLFFQAEIPWLQVH